MACTLMVCHVVSIGTDGLNCLYFVPTIVAISMVIISTTEGMQDFLRIQVGHV